MQPCLVLDQGTPQQHRRLGAGEPIDAGWRLRRQDNRRLLRQLALAEALRYGRAKHAPREPRLAAGLFRMGVRALPGDKTSSDRRHFQLSAGPSSPPLGRTRQTQPRTYRQGLSVGPGFSARRRVRNPIPVRAMGLSDTNGQRGRRQCRHKLTRKPQRSGPGLGACEHRSSSLLPRWRSRHSASMPAACCAR
jgi:hypothetical protein